MSTDLRTVWGHLDLEPDDVLVLSIVLDTRTSPTLLAASLLGGPAMIAQGWPAWRRAEGMTPTPSEELAELPGEFVFEGNGFIAGRVVLSEASARDWISATLADGRSPALGEIPEAVADLAPARAPIRICTHSESAAADLATHLARPVLGFHFPASKDAQWPAPEDRWSIEGTLLFNPAPDALGFSWFKDKRGPLPSGLLLGRFERRAWLAGQRLDPENDLYRVTIGIDPSRAELADLAIELEEAVGEELVLAEHLRLEDTALAEVEKVFYGPPREGGRLEVGVDLPTLGRGIRRAVRLTHRDGTLLDAWERFSIVESVSISVGIFGDSSATTTTTGETRGRQDLVELLGAVERIKSQYAWLRREGAHNRLFDNPEMAIRALRSVLERAPGEILVLDPFFDAWSLLTDLPGPAPRILIGPDAKGPPVGFPGRVRRWRGSLAPFHDRFFLWEGGGMSIGTSPGTTTDRLFRMTRIGAAEAAVLHERFALWWDDPGFVPIPPDSTANPRTVRLGARQEKLLDDLQETLSARKEHDRPVMVDPAGFAAQQKVSVAEVIRDLALLDETSRIEVSAVVVEAVEDDEEAST
jgi:hypothetical protein